MKQLEVLFVLVFLVRTVNTDTAVPSRAVSDEQIVAQAS
jgi:hypothetical protein